MSTYDSGDISVATMQHIAGEGICWVVCSGVALRLDDVPTDMPGYEALCGAYMERNPDAEWINEGDSLIVNPHGEIVEGPLRNEYGILYGEIDTAEVRRNRWCLDAAGHCNRPDIFDFMVNRRRLSPIEFDDAESGQMNMGRRLYDMPRRGLASSTPLRAT